MKRRGMTSRGVQRWKDFEREVARELRKLVATARRGLQFQKGHGVPDVEAGVLWVEVKSGHHRPVARLYLETRERARAGRMGRRHVPAVVTRAQKRGPKLVTLALADFVRLAKAGADWDRHTRGGR